MRSAFRYGLFQSIECDAYALEVPGKRFGGFFADQLSLDPFVVPALEPGNQSYRFPYRESTEGTPNSQKQRL